MGLGYVFSDALEVVAAWASRLGNWIGVVIVAAFGTYALVKYVQRRRFLRELRIARIGPDELKVRLESRDDTFAIIDTRSLLDVIAVPQAIPGAVWIAAEDIARRQQELPRGREIILYCS